MSEMRERLNEKIEMFQPFYRERIERILEIFMILFGKSATMTGAELETAFKSAVSEMKDIFNAIYSGLEVEWVAQVELLMDYEKLAKLNTDLNELIRHKDALVNEANKKSGERWHELAELKDELKVVSSARDAYVYSDSLKRAKIEDLENQVKNLKFMNDNLKQTLASTESAHKYLREDFNGLTQTMQDTNEENSRLKNSVVSLIKERDKFFNKSRVDSELLQEIYSLFVKRAKNVQI